MTNWGEIGKLEKSLRVAFALGMAARLVECVRQEDIIGAAISGLTAVAALGLDAEEIRSVLAALERSGTETDA